MTPRWAAIFFKDGEWEIYFSDGPTEGRAEESVITQAGYTRGWWLMRNGEWTMRLRILDDILAKNIRD